MDLAKYIVIFLTYNVKLTFYTMTYRVRERYAVSYATVSSGILYNVPVYTINFAGKKKMYFLKQDPLRQSEWKLLDIMKNNNCVHKRKRKTASDTEFATDAKSGEFFPAPFPDKCERGKRALGANRKRKRFAFCYVDETAVALHWTVEEHVWRLF